jgi:hypothetical protein
LDSQIIFKVLGAIKPKVLNINAKIGYGHLCLREENLSLNNNYMIYIKYSDFKVTLSRTIFVLVLQNHPIRIKHFEYENVNCDLLGQ